MEDLITVIIPVYNAEKYIAECLESLINQTYKNLEIIVINDGSKDNSGTICDQYKEKDSRIQVIHKENGGVSLARNSGLEIAKGKYIAFVDGDDYLDKEYFEKMLKILKEKQVDIVLCGFNRVYDNNIEKVTKGKSLIMNKEEFLTDILNVQGGAGIVHSKLWKKEVIQGINFDKNIKIGEDSFFCIQAVKNVNNVYVLDEALYNYRFNNESAVRKYKKDFPDLCLTSMKIAKKYIEKEYNNNKNIIKKFNNYIAYHILLIIVNYCFNNENKLNWIGQIKCLKEVCKVPEYKEAIKYSNYDGLSLTRKITLFTIKYKLYFITMLIRKNKTSTI